VNYQIENGKIFLSYAHAHREPNRDDLFANPNTKPEKLHDFELGLEKLLVMFLLLQMLII
jgi:iron complex outermembrane receptor protein